jgi:transposase-like protein
MDKQKWQENIQRIVGEFQHSGLRRREFCEQRGIAVSTLDYWRRKAQAYSTPQLLEVEVTTSESAPGFALHLANGRRIESSWRFSDAELARLIRVVESA